MTAHPATYTDALLPIFAELMPTGPAKILDPFAGIGKITRLRPWLSPPGDLMIPLANLMLRLLARAAHSVA